MVKTLRRNFLKSLGIGCFLAGALGLGACSQHSDGASGDGRRVLVIGWDGATFESMDPLLQAGRLPNLQALMQRGVQAELESTIVPISSAAWAAAVSGKNPGKSGLYSFFEPLPESYDVQLVSSHSLRATPIWRTLARYGKRSVIWGVPVTYPPEPIPGVMVSGMLAPFDADYAHPSHLTDRLRASGFVPDLGMWRQERPIHEAEQLEQQLQLKEQHLKEVLDAEDWSLAWVVFKNLDVLSHAIYDPSMESRVAQLYERLDQTLGRLLEQVGDQTDVLLVSDHGFRRYPRNFQLLDWLLQSGFAGRNQHRTGTQGSGPELAAAGVAAQRRLIGFLDLEQTRLFPTKAEGHFGGLRVNLKGREPKGIVEPEELDELLEQVSTALLGLRNERGKPIVKAVHRAAELYPGEFSESLPDLLVETQPNTLVMVTRQGAPGMSYPDHHRRGIFVAAGPQLQANSDRQEFAIADLAPTVLALLGHAAYKNMDGQVLDSILSGVHVLPAISESDEPEDAAAILKYLSEDMSLSPEQLAAMQERLKQLGYTE